MKLEDARPLDQGMGVAVARRTVFRSSDNEDMGNVANRVALGNTMLNVNSTYVSELIDLRNHLARGSILASGRHLQHGDENQIDRNLEVYSNCATAATSFAKFYLLLNGSGVGRSYDDEMIVTDWAKAPELIVRLSEDHPDYPDDKESLFKFGKEFSILPFSMAWDDFDEERVLEVAAYVDDKIRRDNPEADVRYVVDDSREGWAKAMEIYETMAYEGRSNETLLLDFSLVRPLGSPIGGMQDRPASGPLSIMRGFLNIAEKVVAPARRQDDQILTRPWAQAMHVDHHLSVEVQVGGARRAARMSTKSWLDPDIMDFIRIKSDNGLWTSNNSVMVDREFWERVNVAMSVDGPLNERTNWAFAVFLNATECGYTNGEPGFINGDQLESVKTGEARKRPVHKDGRDFGSQRYTCTHAKDMLADISVRAAQARYPMIVNPCGEIELHPVGGYCVIGDVAPLLACPEDDLTEWEPGINTHVTDEWDWKVLDAVRLQVRMLMRTNLMDSLYKEEVKRTQRIGVSLTGIHEYAWLRFGLTFPQLIHEKVAIEFWSMIGDMSQVAKEEARDYAQELGVEVPHTVLTIKPAGTTSKLHALSEGAHLPARRQYIRWVQFRGQKDRHGNWPADADPLLAEYEAKGYPVRALENFPGMSIVGFPTVPLICRLMPESLIVTAPEATPEEQYRWIQLLEKYWLGSSSGNQVSYTLKVFTDEHDLDDYRAIVRTHQPMVRACAVMPSLKDAALAETFGFEYLPEEEVSLDRFAEIVEAIEDETVKQDVDLETLQCASGACPI